MLTSEEREELAAAVFRDQKGQPVGLDLIAVEAIVARRVREALTEAADDPALRLSGHSGISIRRLRDRASLVAGDGVGT